MFGPTTDGDPSEMTTAADPSELFDGMLRFEMIGAELSENDSSRPSAEATRPLTLPSSTPSAAAIAGTPMTFASDMVVLLRPVAASTSITTSPSATAVAFNVMDTVALPANVTQADDNQASHTHHMRNMRHDLHHTHHTTQHNTKCSALAADIHQHRIGLQRTARCKRHASARTSMHQFHHTRRSCPPLHPHSTCPTGAVG